uniref:Uncharacterized protein n=1 Tax=Dictyoglomus thermophilum TaxID=14 RepID=A0A7C3RNH4_DICTH
MKECPICKKIKEEKEKFYKSLNKPIYLCKEHLKEALLLNPRLYQDKEIQKEDICPICELEKKIISYYNGDFSDLCLYHLKIFEDKIPENTWKILIKEWEDYLKHIHNVIESYSYNQTPLKENYVMEILDLLLGTGRKIR